jgi:hypothetical protein
MTSARGRTGEAAVVMVEGIGARIRAGMEGRTVSCVYHVLGASHPGLLVYVVKLRYRL